MAGLPNLDQLAATVVADAESDDPLEQLATAARARDELDDLSDALLGRFVEQARAAGSSWSQIGSALGVTKQAAQQRHTTPDSVARRLLSRVSSHGRGFTPRARSCVALAQSAAQRLGHNYIGTEHLLLGLFAVPEGLAARVLADLGVTEQSIEAGVKEEIGGCGNAIAYDLPLTPRAQVVLQHTLREALQFGHNYVGTEHILLAVITEGEGLAARLLARGGVRYEDARNKFVGLLTGSA
ncbi:MAG: Clp protease N-terminal domain-containing protein [Actinomycetota bacterium]